MKMALGLLVMGALAVGEAHAKDLEDLTGRWREVRYGALVDIGDCGNGTPCGWLAHIDAHLTAGQTHDVRNRDPGLRARPLNGLPVLSNFVPSPEGWRDGRLYNPDDGKSFRAHLRLLSATELRVTGCLGPLCRSEVWTREGLKRVDLTREGLTREVATRFTSDHAAGSAR